MMSESIALEQFVRLVLTAHVATTWAMVGVILMVQVVHYPLFSSVGASSFTAYEVLHTQRITWIVAPLMVTELLTAIVLVYVSPASVSTSLLWIGLILLAVIWISTAFVQVPLHRELASGFDSLVHRKLLTTNWVRTIAWVTRGLVVAVVVYQYLNPSERTL